jgi:hypothetical protein
MSNWGEQQRQQDLMHQQQEQMRRQQEQARRQQEQMFEAGRRDSMWRARGGGNKHPLIGFVLFLVAVGVMLLIFFSTR